MTYTVRRGDTLRIIALRELGDESLWSTIWTMNQNNIRSGDPSILSVGEVLTLPSRNQPPVTPAATQATPTAGDVRLIVNDRTFTGWEEISVSRSIEAVAGAFMLKVTGAGATGIRPGAECAVKFGEETVILGYVDDIETTFEKDTHTITVTGRDKTCDIVDCSVPTSPTEWANRKLDQIATDLCRPYGIGVWAEVNVGEPIPRFSTQPGETILEALGRAAKGKKVLLTSSARGLLLITKAGTDRTGVTLKEGENIKSITATQSIKERFSRYIVEGQPVVVDGVRSTQGSVTPVVGRASDSGVPRYRPLVMVAEERANQAYCNARAQWESIVRAGKSLTVQVTVPGWWMPNGRIWRPNSLVNVEAPTAGVRGEAIIAEIEYTLTSDSGTETKLTLRQRSAYTDEVEIVPPQPVGSASAGTAGSTTTRLSGPGLGIIPQGRPLEVTQ